MPRGIKTKAKPVEPPKSMKELMFEAARDSAQNFDLVNKSVVDVAETIQTLEEQQKSIAEQLKNNRLRQKELSDPRTIAAPKILCCGQFLFSINDMSLENMETLIGLALTLSKPITNPAISDFILELQESGQKYLDEVEFKETMEDLFKSTDNEEQEDVIENQESSASSSVASEEGTKDGA